MAIPSNWSVVTVTAQYINPDGSFAQGRVKFNINTPGHIANEGASMIMFPKQVVVELDNEGRISVDLPASNDPDVTPSFTWKVTEYLLPNRIFTYEIEIPHDVATLDLSHAEEATGGHIIYRYVRRDGDTMTGYLTLYADPTDPLHAASKQYVDALNAETGQDAVDLMNAHLAADDPHGDRAYARTYTDSVANNLEADLEDYTDQAIVNHTNAIDPHGDRAYTDQEILDHTNAIDPHGDRAYADTVAATAESNANDYTDSELASHVSAIDPHGDRAYTDAEITEHINATDPHGDRAYTDAEILDHTNALDPHGDRAYTDQEVANALVQADAESVSIDGDTMTGFLTLNANPNLNLHAATKQYVDGAEASAQAYTDQAITDHTNAIDPHGDRAYVDTNYVANTEVGVSVASLVNGQIPSSQIPSIAIVETYVVASEAEMLALDAQTGDIAIRSDISRTFVLGGTDPAVLADWYELATPPDAVSSVNGQTGTVVLGPGDVGADPAGTAATEVANHVADTDPHGDRAYTDSELADHVSAIDPHGDRAYTDQEVANALAQADAESVSIDGDTMTGALTLSGDPVNPLEAATKQYVDAAQAAAEANAEAESVSLSGDTMTGPLVLSGDPTGELEASPKQYVDAKILDEIISLLGLSSGIIAGGDLSVNPGDPTMVDISDMEGLILDYTSDEYNPDINRITLSATSVTISNLAAPITWLLVDSSGSVVQQVTRPTNEQRRTHIVLGGVLVSGGEIIEDQSLPSYLPQPLNQLYDLMDALGPFNISGNVLSPAGTNLQLAKTAGTVFSRSFNLYDDFGITNNPHVSQTPSQNPVSLRYVTQTPASPTPLVTSIDPLNYDDGGVVTPIEVGMQRATIQRVFIAPLSDTAQQVVIQYGQHVYDNLEDALIHVGSEQFITNPNLEDAILIGYIVVRRSATDLSDPSQAEVIRAARLSGNAAGSSETLSVAVLLTGSTMTGPLILNADPTDPLGAATKQYVDAAQASAEAYADSTFVPLTDVGSADGVAPLDSGGLVPQIHLPELNNNLSGSGAPSGATGEDADIYIDTDNWEIYGPKTSGEWGDPTDLIGLDGRSAYDIWLDPSATTTEFRYLRDDFESGTASDVWDFYSNGAANTGGRLRIPVEAATFANAYSFDVWKLENSHVDVEMPVVPVADVGTDVYVTMYIRSGVSGTLISIVYDAVADELTFNNQVAFTDPGSVSVAYSAVDHRWLRIREERGTLYWETSSDGAVDNWVVQRSIDTPSWVYNNETLGLTLEGFRDAGASDFGEFDNLGLALPTEQDFLDSLIGPAGTSFPGTHDVLSYGATGDGSTDDTPFIQAALDQCEVDGGGEVFVPGQGRIYSIQTGPLRIYRNTTLTLAPDAIIRRDASGTMLLNGDSDQTFGGYTGHGNIIVQGGTWDANGTVVTTNNMAISIGHADNVTIRDTIIKDVPGFHAIEFNATRRSRAINVKCLGFIDTGSRAFSEAIQIDLALGSAQFGGFGPYDSTPCDDILVQGCTIGPSGTVGTTSWGAGVGSHSFDSGFQHTNIRVVHNDFQDTLQFAVRNYYWNDSVIANNTITGCGAAIWIQSPTAESVEDVIIANNTMRDIGSFNHAVFLDGATTRPIRHVNIIGNVLRTNGGSATGFRLAGVEEATVSGNTLRNTAGTSISQANITATVVTGNRIYESGSSGISCDTGAQCIISDNSVALCQSNGIHIIGGTDISMANNVVKSCGRGTNATFYGYRLSTSVSHFSLVGNRYRGHGSGNEVLNAIGITNTCSNGSVWGNDLRGSNATSFPYNDGSNALNISENISFDPSWFVYTPTLTATTTNPSVGAGSIVGAYHRLGNDVKFEIVITFGAGLSAGNGEYIVSLPFAPIRAGVSSAVASLGASSTPFSMAAHVVSGALRIATPTGGNLTHTGFASNAWTSGNTLRIAGSYEAVNF